MFSESRNNQYWRPHGRRSPQGVSDGDNSAEIGDDAAEIGDDAAGIVDISAKVIPC